VIVIAALQRSRAWDDLHIIVRECHKGVEVAPVEGVNGSADKVHVLLRHGLLRQPQGFEGLGVIPEELNAEDPALAYRENTRELHARLRALARATPDEPHENMVGGVDE